MKIIPGAWSEKKMPRYLSEENPGRFIKPCPGTPEHVCCGYTIIDFAHGCDLQCSYCILDSYFNDNNHMPVLFKNIDRLFKELQETIQSDKLIRFGTGEFTDSLLFEDRSSLYEELVQFISSTHNAILEIKTKTVNIKRLLKIPEHDNTIVSWSLNSEYISRTEERNAPDISQRIAAAGRLAREGYRLGFHFDPIIMHENWEEEYRAVIDSLFRTVDPDIVVYISMGALRFTPSMRDHLVRKDAFYIFDGEFVRGSDNKFRYFRPLRTQLYRGLKRILARYIDEDRLYLCMESPVVWEDVFNLSDMTTKRLSERLDRACRTKFKGLIGRCSR